jgi:hypothetical protein
MLMVIHDATAIVTDATTPPFVQCWHYDAAGDKTKVVCNKVTGTEACARNGTVSTQFWERRTVHVGLSPD